MKLALPGVSQAATFSSKQAPQRPLQRLLEGLRRPLACSDPLETADLIFVLAGQQNRKVYGLGLWREDWAKAIVLSTGRFEIRRFADFNLPGWPRLRELWLSTPPKQRHFFVSFDGSDWHVERIPVATFGTLNEIEALARWLEERPQVASVLIVSSSQHLRRVRMCCRALLPGRVLHRLIALPAEYTLAAGQEPWSEREAIRPTLFEWSKIFLYAVVLALRRIMKGFSSDAR